MTEMDFPKADSILVLAVDRFLQTKMPMLATDTRRAIALVSAFQISWIETAVERGEKHRGGFHLHDSMREILKELATPDTVDGTSQVLAIASQFFVEGFLISEQKGKR